MRLAPQFDRLARAYRWMELVSFGPWLMLTRTTFLQRGTQVKRALVLGDGDGRFTARLLAVNPAVLVDAVDLSGAMLQELVRRAGPDAGRVTIHQADAREWMPPGTDSGYNLIATHFFLDCLPDGEVLSLARRVHKAAAPGACWVLSEFAIPEGRVGGTLARGVVSLLYWAFGWLTGLEVRRLPAYGAAMEASGFERVEMRTRLGGLLVAELWEKQDRLMDESTAGPGAP
jgi:SAM-dependent methyltransferase